MNRSFRISCFMEVKLKELTKRVLMAAWGIPLILGLSYLGSYYFLFLVLIINSIALWEFYSIYRQKNRFAFRIPAIILSVFILLSSFWFEFSVTMFVYLGTILMILILHLKATPSEASSNTFLTISGISYISLFLATLVEIRQNFGMWQQLQSDIFAGGKFLILLWISIWVCDTFAYFGGRLLGKHKLSPKTSPNKTVEGAIFGLIGGIIIFVLFGPLFLPNLSRAFFWTSGIIVGIFGQIGDLVESRFKRDAGVKDTSTILPGHGGFLDRFDSIIFVSPLFYILFYAIRF